MNEFFTYLSAPIILILFGGLITTISAYIGKNTERNNQPRLIRWLVLSGGIITLLGGLFAAVDLAKNESKVITLTEQNASLNNHISNLITGGDSSFCFLSIPIGQTPPFYGDEKHFGGIVKQKGNYPLHDVVLEMIHDFAAAEKLKDLGGISGPLSKMPIPLEGKYKTLAPNIYQEGEQPPDWLNMRDEILIGYLGVGFHYQLPPTFTIIDKDSHEYIILISAKNGRWVENLLLKKVDKIWLQAIQVKKNGKVIYQFVEKGFPKEKDGSINWRAGWDRILKKLKK